MSRAKEPDRSGRVVPDPAAVDDRKLVRTMAELLVEVLSDASRYLDVSPKDVFILMGVAIYSTEPRGPSSVREDVSANMAFVPFKTLSEALNIDRATLRRRLRKLETRDVVECRANTGVRLTARHLDDPTPHRILAMNALRALRRLSE